MRSFDKYSEDFENKILSVDFDKLSFDELKQLEAEGITKEELLEIKSVLLAIKDIENEEIKPKEGLRDTLLLAFDEPKEKHGLIISWPFWISTAASIAALFVLVFYLYKPFENSNENKTVVAQKIESTPKNEMQNSIVNNPQEESVSEVIKIENSDITEDLPAPSNISETSAKPEKDNYALMESRMADATAGSEENSNALNFDVEPTSTQTKSIVTSNASVSQIDISQISGKNKVKNKLNTSMSLSELPGAINSLVTVY